MAKGIITSREQRAQFDQAVKDVIKQRKTANAIQMAAREHKQLSKNGGPSNAQQAAQLQQNREKLKELIRTPEFAMLNNNSGSERKQSSSSSNNRRPSTHLSSSIMSTQSTCVNQEGLQKLREQHPRRLSSSSLRKSGSNRRLTVSGPAPPSSLVKSLPNELEAARRSSAPDQIGGDNPRARRRFSLDKSNSFNVYPQSSSSGMGKKGGMPRVGSEGYALDKMGDGQSLTLNSMGGGQGGGLSKTMHPRNYTSGMSSSSNSGGMGHRSSSSGGMKNGQNDGRLVPTYRPLSKTKGGKVPVAAAAAATSSTGATKENATWGFPSRRSTTQTAIATQSPHKVKTLNGSPGGEGCETYLSTSTNSRKSPPENLNNEGLEEDDRKSSSEGRRGEFTKTISSSSRSGSGMISLSSRSGGIGAAGALDLENIKEGDGSIISDSSSPLGALSNGLGGIKLEELVPTRRKTRDISDGERPSKEKIDQWRDEDLILEPGGDFKIAKKGDEETTFHDANDHRQQEDESPSSFHTANTSSPGNQDVNNNVCPREMLKLQAKSQSGGTGPTTGTSASSLISSEGSFRKITPDQGRGNAGTPDFEAIKEEGKDAGGGDIGNTERSELASGDSVKHIAGFSTYKNRRSSRMKKIRKSIKKTLMGTNGTSSSSSPRGEASSQGGTTISEEQQKRLSQHFQRKSSARSLMSADTSFSAITTKSNATNSSQSSRWPKFRRKSVSMSNVMNAAVARGSSSSSKNILVNQSSRSNVSFLSEDGSGSKGSHLDFYDNSDHVRAVRTSIISARSHSGRSIVSQLETVDEPSQGEQKHDEDLLQSGKSAYHMYIENSSHGSDDTASSFYRHPSHEHLLVHMRPNQLFPDSPGWQCDKCVEETFDLNVWAYISTEENYCLCESCFIVNGFVVDETP